MVKMITNAGRLVNIPNSVRASYEALGWKEYKEEKPAKTKQEKKKPEYLDKPISEWTKTQLKDYADTNKVILDGVTKVEEVRAIVKKHLEEK